MKKILVLCLSLLMLTAFGCKSTSDGDAAPASAAEAKVSVANAAPACATLELNPEASVREDVANVLNSFFENFQIIAKTSNGDCDKFGKDLIELISACEQNVAIAIAAVVQDKSIESILTKQNSETFDAMLEKCEENENVSEFHEHMFAITLTAAAMTATAAQDEGDEDEE